MWQSICDTLTYRDGLFLDIKHVFWKKLVDYGHICFRLIIWDFLHFPKNIAWKVAYCIFKFCSCWCKMVRPSVQEWTVGTGSAGAAGMTTAEYLRYFSTGWDRERRKEWKKGQAAASGCRVTHRNSGQQNKEEKDRKKRDQLKEKEKKRSHVDIPTISVHRRRLQSLRPKNKQMGGSTLSSLVTGWSTVIKYLGDRDKKKRKWKSKGPARERGINITQKLQRERERAREERYLKHRKKKDRDKETESRRELWFDMLEKVRLWIVYFWKQWHSAGFAVRFIFCGILGTMST